MRGCRRYGWRQAVLLLVALLALDVGLGRADTFTCIDVEGKTSKVEARLIGEGQGACVLEKADGQLLIVPQSAIKQRKTAPGPEPLDDDAVIENLAKQFGSDLFRAHKQPPYVIGLILTAPLPERSEKRTQGFLKRAARFMRSVDGVFLRYAKSVRFPVKPPTHPMVVLIFEADADFEQYAKEVTGDRGLSSEHIAGFYSAITNYLALRMRECHTFETPLHEAIHQQVFSRHVFRRLAPVPAWFNEGIATGFEGNGERINIGPAKLSLRYARMAANARRIDWQTIVANDGPFEGDAFASEAYGHGWGLHWLLVTKYKVHYMQYVQHLSQLKPLAQDSPEQRIQQFEKIVGKSVTELQGEFPQALATALKRQRITLQPESPPGHLKTQQNQGEVEMSAVSRLDYAGALQVHGTLKNLSFLRPLSFLVVVETDAGTYADWHVPDLAIQRSVTLPTQFARKLMPNARGGRSSTFRVRIRSTLTDSAEAIRWRNRGR